MSIWGMSIWRQLIVTNKDEHAKLVERARNNLFEERQKKDITIIQKAPNFGMEGAKRIKNGDK